METTFETTPEIKPKTIDQPQQLFVKLFEGNPITITSYINDWLAETAKKIQIEEQNMTTLQSGNEVKVYVLFRFLWINR